MATITDTVGARIVLDLIKDRTVTTAAPYDNVDQATAALALKYGQALWDVFHDPPGGNPTNAQLAAFFFAHMKQHLKETLIRARSRAAGRAAQAAEQTTATAEGITDLGNG